MGRFKTSKMEQIRENKEKSRKAIDKGRDLQRQAEQIKSFMNEINLRDDDAKDAIENTNRGYQVDFNNEFFNQVETLEQEVKSDSENIKADIGIEQQNTEFAIQQLEKAADVSDIGRTNAADLQSKMNYDKMEYERMVRELDESLTETSSAIKTTKSFLERIF